jgi:hypothetical protein
MNMAYIWKNMMFNLVIQTTGVPVYYFVFGAKLVVVNSW